MQSYPTVLNNMSRYELALEAKQETIKKLGNDPLGAINQVLISMVPDLQGERYSMAQMQTAKAMVGLMLAELEISETYFWSDTICDIINVAAETLPSDTVITKEMVPDICGFTWLEKKIKLPNLTDEYLEGMEPNLRTIIQDLHLSAFSWYRSETSIAVTSWVSANNIPLQAPYHTIPIKFGEPFLQNYQPTGDLALAGKIFVSSLLFLQQQLLESRVGYPSRPLMRRLQRAKTSKNNSQVNVITLRRPRHNNHYDEAEDRKHVEWSCQWLVKGFWRNQPYPATNEHRNIWIFPYIKGPDDKPFQSKKETIMAVVR